jgi:hypothetical protein
VCPHLIRPPELSGNYWQTSVKKQEKLVEEIADAFCLRSIYFVLVGIFNVPHNLTRDRRLYLPSEDGRSSDFIAFKNMSSSAGFESVNLGSNGKYDGH